MTTAVTERTLANLAVPGQGEFQRNWKMMIACVVGCAFCMGTIASYSIGPFVKPIGVETGWSRTAIQAALLFGQGLSAIGAILAGVLLEKLGARTMAIVGLLGTGLAFVLASMSESLLLFYVSYAIAALVGAGAGFITWSRALTQSFDKHRAFALAVALSGTGISGVVLPPVLVHVIANYGWRMGYIALAAFPILIALPLVLFLFKGQEQTQRSSVHTPVHGAQGQATGSSLVVLRSYRFWVLMTSIVCVYFAVVGILPNFIPALSDAGLSAERAAVAQGAFAVALVIGRLLVGFLADRFWAPAVGAIFLSPPAVGCLLLINEPTFATAAVAAAMVGVGAGAELDLLALLTSRYFEPRLFARTYSYLYAAVAVAGGTAPMTFAWLRELSGNYTLGFSIAMALFVVGGPVLLTLGRYPVFQGASKVEAA